MNKYIDAEKLKEKIKRRLDELNPKAGMLGDMSLRSVNPNTFPRESELEKVLYLIDSLQQEQPECGCSKKPNNLLSEKRDLPEADLEKEIEQAGKDVIRQAHYHNKIFNIPQNIFDDVQLMDIFKAGVYKDCELGFNARK